MDNWISMGKAGKSLFYGFVMQLGWWTQVRIVTTATTELGPEEEGGQVGSSLRDFELAGTQ